jgi:hypothetical protein
MRVSAPTVVAAWGLLNIALAVTLAGFGEQPAVIALYGSAAALVEIIAAVVWVGARYRRGGQACRQAPNGDNMLVLGAGILIAGLGLAFAWYLGLLAIPVLAMAAVREVAARHEGR